MIWLLWAALCIGFLLGWMARVRMEEFNRVRSDS